jgi:tetratricopeptide (TPR) repeat protein
MTNDDWAARVAAVWDESDELGDNILLEKIDALVAERPETDAEALFEAASVRDSLGFEAEAAPLYQRSLDAGLSGYNKGRALIQMASTLRNLGRYTEGLALLDQLEPGNPLADAEAATRALILVNMGRATEGAGIAIRALAPHLPRYQRSMRNYAQAILDEL